MSRTKEFVNKISQVSSGTEIEELLKEFLEYEKEKIIRCNNCGGELHRTTHCHVVACQACLKGKDLEYGDHLSLLLTWIVTGIPKKEVNHVCGNEYTSCDQSCVTFAEFCRDVSQAKKAINYKMISVDVSDCDPISIISGNKITNDEAKFMLHHFVSIKSDGPRKGWSKVHQVYINQVHKIEEIDWSTKWSIRLSCSSAVWWHPDDLNPEEKR